MPGKVNLVGGSPTSGTVAQSGIEQVVDPTFGAARVSLRPEDHLLNGQVLGHYRVAAVSGATTTLAAGNLLFSFRYGDANSVALLKRVKMFCAVTTGFNAAQVVDCDIISVRGWTTSDTAGTAIVLAGNTNKQRTNMGTSRVSTYGDIRVATASAIGAGATKTPDSNAFGYGVFPAATTTVTSGFMGDDLYRVDLVSQHPIVYAGNEGFNIRVVTTQGTAGVVKFYFVVEWAELLGY